MAKSPATQAALPSRRRGAGKPAENGSRTKDITFIVPGQAQAAASATTRGAVKATVRDGTERGGGEPVRVSARPGRDIVVLEIANGPTLVLHPAAARDLMLAQSASVTRSALAGARGMPSDVLVPAQLGWPGLEAEATHGTTRGWLGQALLTGFQVLTSDMLDPAAKLAAAASTKNVDAQVDAGVYTLAADALEPLKGSARRLDVVPPAVDGRPMLVLIHGTFSETVGTFGKLWALHNAIVRQLFASYGGRVYALDHPTLGTSPIGNALTLVRALPAGARVHLLTHSRGGLVGEALARACSGRHVRDDALGHFGGHDYGQHRSDLLALFREAQAKGIRCERVVRVGCPARGTLLASKRLDAYLSILNWCLELAGIPVVPEVVDFLQEVARRRAEPAELPGLEAMTPDSPVIQWLNNATETIPGELRVVAGDMEGDSIGSWAKTLLSDAFYWTDNDLVVQTRSMYGGAPRAKTASGSGARFLLDKGGKVSHFNYFSNERTVRAIASALLDDLPADFAAIGPLSWAGEDASGTRAAVAVARSRGADGADAGDRPAVFVIPGIVGSNLKKDGKRIWLGFRIVNGLSSLAWDPATAASVEPDGPVANLYGDLIERLADSHEVIPFAYDWRRPIEDEARRLGAAIDAALAARESSQQPVRIVAHSMGGLVARTMALEKPDTWARMMARDGARFVMLGTPNGGSWSPMQTLSGDDTFGNALAAFGSLFDNIASREVMAGMPGFLQLQAVLLDPTFGLDRSETWQQLAAEDLQKLLDRSLWHLEGVQKTIYGWSAPPQAVLDLAVALRRRLDAQAGAFASDGKTLLVVGSAPFTPGGIVMGESGLEYTDAVGGGDGRVPLTSAVLPGVRTWKLDAAHGDLPTVAKAFPAYLELLERGDTALLETLDLASVSALRSAPEAATAVARSRPSRGAQPSLPPSTPADALGVGTRDPAEVVRSTNAGRALHVSVVNADVKFEVVRNATAGRALHVSVLNADLKFVHQPLVVGHYRSLTLTGTEAVVDRLVSRAMSRSLAAGLYPEAVGSQQIFGNVRKDPNNVLAMARPLAVIVAGLGEEGKLRAVDLVYTVRQAVIAYAQRLAEKEGGAPAEFELAATLIGSGGTGISAGTAAQLIAQGTWEANQKLHDGGWPQVGRLILVEFYLDRASEAWRSLDVQATAAPSQLKVVGFVQSGAGALRRSLDSSYRGASYDFISATLGKPDDGGSPTITYTLDTKRARTEVRAQQTQTSFVKELVAKASNEVNRDPEIGRTLFDCLVPVEIEPFLGGTSEMVIELERETAALPWEMLETRSQELAGSDPRPWAIRSKLLRKLRTKEFRSQVSDATADGSILVIGEPLVDETMYPPLPGARAEAIAVATRLTSGPAGVDAARVRALTSGEDARSVITALFERTYRIVHVAGHGAPGPDGGVVLSGGTYLGAAEVKAMRIVPELVFLNCCHLAALDAKTVLAPYDRAELAATIAEALIEVGVRCVIVAGWAVEDKPAELFATTFYDALLSGSRFMDAVAAARTAAWRGGDGVNTWAAYQCYGDPGWTWQRDVGDAQRQTSLPSDQFGGVSSPPALTLALETISIQLRFGGDVDPARQRIVVQAQRDKIRFLEEKFAALWGRMGAVAEAFGLAYADARDVDKAIEWYRAAVDADDGSASFKAAEELGNQLARRGESRPDSAHGRRDVEEAIHHLSSLVQVRPTVEREALLGSAYKRLVMIESRADAGANAGGAHSRGRAAAGDRLAALRAMALHYGNAERLARAANADNVFYPAKNAISAELRLAFLERRPAELAVDRMRVVQESLARAANESPDFWSVVGLIELRMLEAVAAQRLADWSGALIAEFSDLKAHVPARGMWDSVHSEARFTLEPYLGIASAAEKRAATALLDALAEMASSTTIVAPEPFAAERRGELVDAIAAAFTPEDLQRRVMDALNVPAGVRSAARSYRKRVIELVNWAIDNGRVAELLRVCVQANPNSSALRAMLAEAVRGPIGSSALEAILPAPIVGGAANPQLVEAQRQICVVEARVAGEPRVGTGFLIGPDQVMTHSTLLGLDASQVESTLKAGVAVTFDVDRGAESSQTYAVLPEVVFHAEGGVAVLRLERAAGQEVSAGAASSARARGWLSLQPRHSNSPKITVVMYAEGKQLMVSSEDAGVVREDEGFIFYRAATYPAATGAPCLDADFQLLGMHVGRAADGLNRGVGLELILRQLGEAGLRYDVTSGVHELSETAGEPVGAAADLNEVVRGFELVERGGDARDHVWNDQTEGVDTTLSESDRWAWAEAAAVVSYFRPEQLRPEGSPRESGRVAVMVNSSPMSRPDGRTRWQLAEPLRVRALERLAERNALRAARERNPGDSDDELNNVLGAFIRGEPPSRLDLQDPERLRAMAQAAGWLARTGITLPATQDLRTSLERATLIAPFRHLTRGFFAGRDTELAALAQYVEAPDSEARNRSSPPILLFAQGGMGKSALLARFILAHSERDTTRPDSWRPFVYLDFDRPELDARDRAGVLLAIARQIAAQVPGVENKVIQLEEEANKRRRAARVAAAGAKGRRAHLVSALSPTDLDALVTKLAGVLTAAHQVMRSPIVLVLDTLEEVQYATPDAVLPLARLVIKLRSLVPSLRPILSGRVAIEGPITLTPVKLGPLPDTAAELLLSNHLPPELAKKIDLIKRMVNIVGGNPLSLRLAADVLSREVDASFDELGEQELWQRVGDSIVQGQLYERIAGHLHNGPVQQIAIPGLVLRYITWELIHDVLASPCGLELKNEAAAKALFRALAREVHLVRQGGDASRLVLRPELRRTVLDSFRQDAKSKEKRLLIHHRAVEFFARSPSPEHRAEEIYHRLWLDQDPDEIDALWVDGIEVSLRSAVEELEGRARAYLAGRVGGTSGRAIASDAPLDEWEAYAERRSSDLLRLGSIDEALAVLRARSDRLPTSRLHLIEGVALRSLPEPDLAAAEQAAERALTAARAGGDADEVQNALQELVQLRRMRNDTRGLMHALAELGNLGEQLGDDLLVLEAEVEELESTDPSSVEAQHLSDTAIRVFSRLPDELIARAPELARRVAAQVGRDHPAVLQRVLRLVGLGALTTQSAAGLAEVLQSWGRRDDAVAPLVPKAPAAAAELASATQMLFASRAPDEQTARAFSAWFRAALKTASGLPQGDEFVSTSMR
jgi:tetratricopeptide (TPR) repeat protein